jgi:acyl-coenzyme A synthetase/AMP-(fatty) acid ligase
MRSVIHIDIFNTNDIIIQMARCTFDVHIQDIIGSLVIGATLVMLHPEGHMEFDYLTEIVKQKHITYMETVPTLLNAFFDYLETNNLIHTLLSLRTLVSGGKFDRN